MVVTYCYLEGENYKFRNSCEISRPPIKLKRSRKYIQASNFLSRAPINLKN